jgi:hypothetical protein
MVSMMEMYFRVIYTLFIENATGAVNNEKNPLMPIVESKTRRIQVNGSLFGNQSGLEL